jgi:uncharacterized membrane protein YccC
MKFVPSDTYAGASDRATKAVTTGTVVSTPHHDPNQFLSVNWKMVVITVFVATLSAGAAEVFTSYLRTRYNLRRGDN